jgi:hypothetical protein
MTTKLNDKELIETLRNISMKADFANSQILHLGLIVEYYAEVLTAAGIDLQLDKYEEWAKNRYEEIKQFSKTELGTELAQEFKEQLSKISEIDLME